jgi:hypothetical protein
VDGAEAIVASKLETLKAALAEAEVAEEAAFDASGLGVRNSSAAPRPTAKQLREEAKAEAEYERLEGEVSQLRAQVGLLEEIKGILEKQRLETKMQFSAIATRDAASTRLNLTASVLLSLGTLLVGWSLSLLGTPFSVWQAIGH